MSRSGQCLLWVLACGLSSACADDVETRAENCREGLVCSCAGGQLGVQTCVSESVFGACQCGDADSDAGDSGNPGDGGEDTSPVDGGDASDGGEDEGGDIADGTDATHSGDGADGGDGGALAAPELVIVQAEPDENDEMTCEVVGGEDPELTYFIHWESDDRSNPVDSPTVPAGIVRLGEYWTCVAHVEDGEETSDESRASVLIGSHEGLLVKLTWETPDDPVEEDFTGSDMDLHLRRGETSWNEAPNDCMWNNRTPDWGAAGGDGNPAMLRDDVNGLGPELITLVEPEGTASVGVRYYIGVHYWAAAEEWEAFPIVSLFADGVLVQRFEGESMTPQQAWEVAFITWPTQAVADIDAYHDQGLPCEDCPELNCGDGVDNDDDDFEDCEDTDCADACGRHEARCTDGTDDDNDAFIDCEDRDCMGFCEGLYCPDDAECRCFDGDDEDVDGFEDCEDDDCRGVCGVCLGSLAECNCRDGLDNDQADAAVDCNDTACLGAICADTMVCGGDGCDCQATLSGVEACDGRDNNCNLETDEDVCGPMDLASASVLVDLDTLTPRTQFSPLYLSEARQLLLLDVTSLASLGSLHRISIDGDVIEENWAENLAEGTRALAQSPNGRWYLAAGQLGIYPLRIDGSVGPVVYAEERGALTRALAVDRDEAIYFNEGTAVFRRLSPTTAALVCTLGADAVDLAVREDGQAIYYATTGSLGTCAVAGGTSSSTVFAPDGEEYVGLEVGAFGYGYAARNSSTGEGGAIDRWLLGENEVSTLIESEEPIWAIAFDLRDGDLIIVTVGYDMYGIEVE